MGESAASRRGCGESVGIRSQRDLPDRGGRPMEPVKSHWNPSLTIDSRDGVVFICVEQLTSNREVCGMRIRNRSSWTGRN